jgi:hypothetical protein
MEITIFYALVRNLHATIKGMPADWFHVHADFNWGTDLFRRADREDFGERIQFHQKKVKLGATFLIGEKFAVDVHGGYAFDRFLYEGERYDDRDDDRIKLDDGAFAGVSLKLKF